MQYILVLENYKVSFNVHPMNVNMKQRLLKAAFWRKLFLAAVPKLQPSLIFVQPVIGDYHITED